MNDLISRQAAIAATDFSDYVGLSVYDVKKVTDEVVKELKRLPSARPEPLTDEEQRIFLKAISREEEVCRKVDAEWGEGDEECEIYLSHVCQEIIRKVKGVLWT